jgi:hypothetical protein
MALKRLDREYEATIKAEIKDKENDYEQEEKMMMYESDSDEGNENENNYKQNYQRLDEADDHNKFGEFEEYGSSNTDNEENKVDVKSLEFYEDAKVVNNIDVTEMNNNISCHVETKTIENTTQTSKHTTDNIGYNKFNDKEKERIKNAMKQINIKPPNWAKKYLNCKCSVSDEDFLKLIKSRIYK